MVRSTGLSWGLALLGRCAVALMCCACLSANNIVPFPIIQFAPYWSWEVTANTVTWAILGFGFCSIIEWLIYAYAGIFDRPLLGSLVANTVTTISGFVYGAIGILLAYSGLNILALLIPIGMTVLIEYAVLTRFRREDIGRRRILRWVLIANAVSNLMLAALILYKANR